MRRNDELPTSVWKFHGNVYIKYFLVCFRNIKIARDGHFYRILFRKLGPLFFL